MFRIKNKKNRIPLQTRFFFFYIKVGFKGVYISRTCFSDAAMLENSANSRSNCSVALEQYQWLFHYLLLRDIILLRYEIVHV